MSLFNQTHSTPDHPILRESYIAKKKGGNHPYYKLSMWMYGALDSLVPLDPKSKKYLV
jgi:hypothetical protein